MSERTPSAAAAAATGGRGGGVTDKQTGRGRWKKSRRESLKDREVGTCLCARQADSADIYLRSR